MTQTADLIDRLNRLAYRRDQEGIYTDAMIVSEAATALAERERRIGELTRERDSFVSKLLASMSRLGGDALSAQTSLEKAEAILARVADVLGPFAREAAEWSWKFGDEQQVSCRPGPPHDEDEVAHFTVGHLRAARALYEEARALAKAEAPEIEGGERHDASDPA